MKTAYPLVLAILLLAAAPQMALAQSGAESANTVTTSLQGLHDITAGNILQTAEMLDDEMYMYQPTDEVRSAGQILAHIAGAQFLFCSVAADEENPSGENFEETATAKSDIVAALQSGFDYCGTVYDAMTDDHGAEMRNLFGMEMAASAVLAFNSAHNYEHYGNLVTYMRMNDLVPPSSQ
jgi:uncharacterized damage-inducible protein DinB